MRNLDHLYLGVKTPKISTMKLSEVYVLSEQKLKKLCCTVAAKRVFFVVVVILVIVQAVFTLLYPIQKVKQLEKEVHDELYDAKDEIRKNINNSLRRFINETLSAAIDRIRQLPLNPGRELRQSFKDMRSHLNVLIFDVGNLSAVLAMNSSSDPRISRLFGELNATQIKLIRLRTKLTNLNYSLHNDMEALVAEAVNDLRRQLNMLRNSTTDNVGKLWKQWNRTDAEMEDVVKLFAQQNQTLHFKMAYHSDVLYSELKDVERKQSKFHSDMRRMLNELRSDMNETVYRFQQSVYNQIAHVNKTWNEALGNAVGSLRLSVMAKTDAKVNRVNHELQKHINVSISQHSQVKDELSKAIAKFLENDRKHDQAISGQKLKIEKTEKRVAKLEDDGKLQSQMIKELKNKIIDLNNERKSDLQEMHDLKDRVQKMENRASGLLETDIRLIFVFLSAVVMLTGQ